MISVLYFGYVKLTFRNHPAPLLHNYFEICHQKISKRIDRSIIVQFTDYKNMQKSDCNQGFSKTYINCTTTCRTASNLGSKNTCFPNITLHVLGLNWVGALSNMLFKVAMTLRNVVEVVVVVVAAVVCAVVPSNTYAKNKLLGKHNKFRVLKHTRDKINKAHEISNPRFTGQCTVPIAIGPMWLESNRILESNQLHLEIAGFLANRP